MPDFDKIEVWFFLGVIAIGVFSIGFGVGVAIGQEMQIKEQKTQLIEQINLLKEHIALQDKFLKLQKRWRDE